MHKKKKTKSNHATGGKKPEIREMKCQCGSQGCTVVWRESREQAHDSMVKVTLRNGTGIRFIDSEHLSHYYGSYKKTILMTETIKVHKMFRSLR